MKIKENPSVILIGSVNSSRKTLEKLIEYKINIVGILGLDPIVSKNISGYVDLRFIAEENAIPFQYFININSQETIDFVKQQDVDFLFIVGLSQMVFKPLLQTPKYGCIGFHPTKLPKGRGRGAVAWIVLGKAEGAATFFHMDEGMDTGDIWAQESFETGNEDYAQDVINKIVGSIDKALDRVLPDFKKGEFKTTPQLHQEATYLAKRNPEDGLIDWNKSAEEIHQLIRAVSHPLPGAYTYGGLTPLKIYRASISGIKNHVGVPGRIIISNENDGVHVQTERGLLKLEEFEGISKDKLKVGYSLGFKIEKEFFKLLEKVEQIKSKDE